MKDLRYKFRLALAHKDAIRTRFFFSRMMENYARKGRKAVMRLKDKEVIEVAFFLPIPGMWKADYLFKAMQEHPRFHPYVVIIPYSCFKDFAEEDVQETVRKTEAFIQERGYEYVIPYDRAAGRWQDVRKTLNPDIVFFSSPYRDVVSQYYLHHFKNRLTCYIPYGFVGMTLYKLNYDQISSNLYGMYFLESQLHLEFARKYSRSGGRNFVVTGYPGTEVYLREDYQPKNVWKAQAHPKKRVIWGPHHTIDSTEDSNWSTFLSYCDVMLKMAEKYRDSIQFAFKPHQLLRFKLVKLWGRERTDAYYYRRAAMENTQLEESSYTDLFLQSDAMIHDSGGFTTEYMFVKKPVMYLVGNQDANSMFNSLGIKAFNLHYQGRCAEDIDCFLQQVVLQGDDNMARQRQEFFDTYLSPKEGMLPSQKIIQTILSAADGEDVWNK